MVIPNIPYYAEENLNLTNKISNEIVISNNDNLTGWRNLNYINNIDFKISKICKDNIFHQINEETNTIDFNFNSNFQNIQNKFDKEFARYSDYIRTDKDEAKKSFVNVSKFISNIDYERIALEITPSNAVKFTMILIEEVILSIVKPFDKVNGLEENEVIFNLYKNKELLVSDAAKVDELVRGINIYIKK